MSQIKDCKLWYLKQKKIDIQLSPLYFEYQNYVKLIHMKAIG